MISLRKIFHKHKLLLRLLSMTFTLVIVTLLIMFFILTRTSKQSFVDSQADMLLKVGHEIAADSFVQSSAEDTHFSQKIIDYASAEEARFGLDYVVIMTKDSTRLTHPNRHLIGSPFQGEQDQYDALNGKSYTRTGQGPMGRSMRAFVPIFNQDHQVVGAVALGIMLPKLNLLFDQATQSLRLSVLVAFLVAGTMAIWLAYSLKNRMLGMEPEEIAQVVEERNAMFNYTDMAILITDPAGKIRFENNSAITYIGNYLNQHYSAIFPDLKVKDKAFMSLMKSVKHDEYVGSVAPIIVNQEKRGYLFILRNALEVIDLVNQLENSHYFAKQLVKQNHDFLNKVHVIYGLSDLGEYQELKTYLQDLISDKSHFNQNVQLLINNPTIAGYLLLGANHYAMYRRITVKNEIPEAQNFNQNNEWLKIANALEARLNELDDQVTIEIELEYDNDQLVTAFYVYPDLGCYPEVGQDLEKIESDLNQVEISNNGEFFVLTYQVNYGG
ncbi:Spo0B domain-containing protein [Aerococcus urinae]|nr:Spo0B domain-containing protein [Aerococcus urinae]AMB96463.1 hypothetical protein AWM73_08085 [Aerococcus urinae]MCY3032164.1 Spo0B domain-containing protein [Aerococcus urinae]MCY3037670.1 Spo0B domain-containing protein [Aerococcus urinae]MCY3044210.1 Spo0B domain-containing protein [Aerococcus urinae]MCY3047665.1 Spo0B domain-containing protein [Aerococcus urinae]